MPSVLLHEPEPLYYNSRDTCGTAAILLDVPIDSPMAMTADIHRIGRSPFTKARGTGFLTIKGFRRDLLDLVGHVEGGWWDGEG